MEVLSPMMAIYIIMGMLWAMANFFDPEGAGDIFNAAIKRNIIPIVSVPIGMLVGVLILSSLSV